MTGMSQIAISCSFTGFWYFQNLAIDVVPLSCLGSSRLPPQNLCVETAVSVVIETVNLNETAFFPNFVLENSLTELIIYLPLGKE